MPFLRFSRDKRGYENTYVLHTFRKDGRSSPRLLYWFRTPPSVKVGRHALDAEAIRSIEENNPDLSFDWTKMLKVKPPPLPKEGRGAGRGSAKRARRSRGRGQADDRAPVERTASVETEVPPAAPEPLAVQPSESTEDRDAEHEPTVDQAAASVAEPNEPEPEIEVEAVDVEALGPDEPREHPVVTLMGDETLARIRARYAEIQLRIDEKFEDPAAGDQIRARAEALDPDRWATVEQAVRGIETFEAEAEAIRGILGRRPPRARRGKVD